MLQNFILNLSALSFGGGMLFCVWAIIYAKTKRKISTKVFAVTCFSFAFCSLANLFVALTFQALPFWQFSVISFAILGVFGLGVLIFRHLPTKLRQGVDLSSGEEWINLSYLLTLIERAERFSLSSPEQEFMESFKSKIRRMTSYYACELPTGIEISRFYKICYRLGIV